MTGRALAFYRGARAWLRRPGIAGLGLIAPAIVLLVVILLIPIGRFLFLSVSNPEIPELLPRTVIALANWDGRELPHSSAFGALKQDLERIAGTAGAGRLARRLNFEMPGARTLVLRTATRLRTDAADPRAELVGVDARWGDPQIWIILKRESSNFTPFYYLTALDLRQTYDDSLELVPEGQRIFVDVLGRTFTISALTMLFCLILGYPAAHLMASTSARWAPVLMTMVLLPFWTSTLVRTTAWIVLLQNEGLVNRTLRGIGLISGSLPLFANRFAVLLAMTHVLLPYMVLPIYGAMKAVPPELLRAASGLGANPIRAFARVYVPQTLHGVYAGCILVFVLALGFYVTPALVGAPSDQMMSFFVALYTNESLNWGLASALGTVLLLSAAIVYLGAATFGVRIISR